MNDVSTLLQHLATHEDGYFQPKLCGLCGGSCCKSMGCELSPDDLKEPVSEESLRALLATGAVSIDFWEGDVYSPDDLNHWIPGSYSGRLYDEVFFLRMRHVKAPISDPSWGGVCCLLSDTGCPIPASQRPKGARMLEPISITREVTYYADDVAEVATQQHECYGHYTKRDAACEWRPYHDLLEQLYIEFMEAAD